MPGYPARKDTRRSTSTAILSRVTMVGALYMAAVCLLPTVLAGSLQMNVPFYFGGTALLIVRRCRARHDRTDRGASGFPSIRGIRQWHAHPRKARPMSARTQDAVARAAGSRQGNPGAAPGRKILAIPQISTGDMLRAAVADRTPVGIEAKVFMDRGDLVPDSVVINVAGERLARADAIDGFILDGFPRTAAQAKALDDLLGGMGSKLEVCLALVVDEEAVVERLLKRAEIEKRSDDNEATIRNRIDVYRTSTEPLLAYYRERGVLREIDGMGCVEEIAARVEEALGG